MTQQMELTGKLLIAMPGMGDQRFDQALIFVCAHTDEGAMGLVINKPTGNLQLKDLLDQLSITPGEDIRNLPVHLGGPVENGRGFVLHDYGYHSAISTLDVNDSFAMTATLDILEDLAQGRGPGHALIALGYAGWGPDQMEQEIAMNGWLICDSDPALVFECPDHEKWESALKKLGISALTLSSEAGHA